MEKEKRIPDQSLAEQGIEVLGQALETPGSLVRNTLAKGIAGLGGKDLSIDYGDIFKGKDYFEAHELIDLAAKTIGFDGYDTHGDNWLESTLKFGAELMVDVATDPITYIPFAGQAYQVGKQLGRVTTKLIKPILRGAQPVAKFFGMGATAKKLAPYVMKGVVNQAEKSALSMATGAALGAGVPVDEDSESPVWDRLRNAGAGAGLAYMGSPVANGIISSGRYVSDQAVSAIYKHASPKVMQDYNMFLSPAAARKVGNEAKLRFSGVSREVRRMNAKLAETFEPKDLDYAIKQFDRKIPKYVRMRDELYEIRGITKTGKNGKVKNLLKGEARYEAENAVAKELNIKIKMDMVNEGVWTPAMDAMIDRNQRIVKMYNDAVAPQYLAKGQKHTPLVGIDIHTPEIFDKDAIGDSLNRATKGWLKRDTKESVRTGGLSASQRFEEEANRVIFPMMEQHERDAIKFMTDLRNVDFKDKAGYKWASETLAKFDNVTGGMKAAMLGLSHSWIKNNFAENVLRTYVEHGPVSAVHVAGKQAQGALARIPKLGKMFQNDLVNDILNVTATPEARAAYIKYADNTGLAQVGVEYGALNGGFFTETLKSINEKEAQAVLVARHGRFGLADKVKALEGEGHFVKGVKGILEGARRIVGETGSVMENVTRANSLEAFIKTNATKEQRKLIKKHGYINARNYDETLDEVYKKSTKMTDDAFFDYSDLSLGEEQILKRILPFYSFYSKNMVYWGEKMSARMDHVAKSLKVPLTMVNYDPAMPLSEKMRLTEYERSIPHGKDSEGNTITAGGFSMTDYMEAFSDPSAYAKGKLHPFLGAGSSLLQIAGNKAGIFSTPATDSLGRKLLPSTDERNKIRAPYYSEKKVALIDDMLGSWGGTTRKENGDLRISGDIVPAIAAVTNLFPVPIIDTAADLMAKGDFESKVSLVKTARPSLESKIKTYRRNKVAIREPFQQFAKENMVKHIVANYKNKRFTKTDIDNQTNVYTDPKMAIVADKLKAQETMERGSAFVNEGKQKSKSWNVLGLRSSPSLINDLAKSEGYVPVARILGKGKHREGSYSIGHSVYKTYPATYGLHKEGAKIKSGDVMSKKEAAFQLAAHVGKSEKILDRVLDRAGVKVTQGIYDAFMHSTYNTGAGYLKDFTGNIAEYFMRLPATVNQYHHPALLKRRAKEYYMAKKEADHILSSTVEYVRSSAMPPHKKSAALKKAYKAFYFPQTFKPLRRNEKMLLPFQVTAN